MNFTIDTHLLPAAEIAEALNEALAERNTVVVSAPAGAGKSTLLPLTMLDALPSDGKILMLEPRRLAARQIACRMAEMVGEQVGEMVGYRIRFENRVSKATRIEVLTEGILTRMLQTDNELQGVSAVVFDEFHERSLVADVALALCRECQQVLRPDLRIVVMSATLDVDALSARLAAPVISCSGRMFPVEIRREVECDPMTIVQMVSHVVRKSFADDEGDVLVFLPGEAEIRQCEEVLESALPTARICPLYGMMPQTAQRAAIMPDKDGRRKVVLSTSIAETSLTIEGVRVVVDSGYCRRLKFDPNSGLSRLELARISLDMAAQRAGRAGRLSSGICYRLWSAATEERMRLHREPEIETADLAGLVLDLALWGESDFTQLMWLSPPPRGHVLQAQELLQMLGALDERNRITAHGRRVGHLPCHPRVAQMLLTAETPEAQALATDVAAVLDERDPLGREAGVDINLRIEHLRRFRSEKRGVRALSRVEKVAAQYRNLLKINADNGVVDVYTTGRLIAAAYPERIASAHAGNNAQFMLSGGNLAQIAHTDDLAHEQWLAVAHMDARDGLGKIFLASPLDPSDLRSHVVERENVSWNTKKGGIVAERELRIGRLVLSTKPLHGVGRERIEAAIVKAIETEGAHILNFDDELRQLQHRVLSLQKWNGAWPDFSTTALLSTARDWLLPYLGNVTTAEQLKRVDIRNALLYSLSVEQQSELSRLAPTHVEVPSGSRIRLDYQANGDAPILAVRLQEMFGLEETPRVNGGRTSVVLHLLSPGYKPVQITQDLRSFWAEAYFEVRKELRRRYPKHVWPDDPIHEAPTRHAKRSTRP